MFNKNPICINQRALLILLYLPLFLILFSGLQIAQTNPDYKERQFQNYRDSLKISRTADIGEATIDPDQYKVGPGENIFISISGIEETNFNLFINIENYLFIPKVGGINLKGLTLTQAKEKIKSTLEKYYRNVEIFISLANLKKIKVFILGDIERPVLAVVESNTKLFDLLLDSSQF